ncbi:hypothetical protein [Pectobacterium phage Wc4-1]|uniref:Uncharacterized protein n=1 Tax=Pectobacterium phage Wc4 TaxID=2652428 RepID=A0A5P8D736_9CAUD|nr:hypothetical protein [Pectobacterium phage Wc4]QFP93985.1 hypothetical protein [Pectobacterium phage Wc4-1]
MKSENCVFHGRYALCFYGVPSAEEKALGKRIIQKLINRKLMLTSENYRVVGFQAIGSSVSNDKLCTGSSRGRRDAIIRALHHNIKDVAAADIRATVDGDCGKYRTFVFNKEHLARIFKYAHWVDNK